MTGDEYKKMADLTAQNAVALKYLRLIEKGADPLSRGYAQQALKVMLSDSPDDWEGSAALGPVNSDEPPLF